MDCTRSGKPYLGSIGKLSGVQGSLEWYVKCSGYEYYAFFWGRVRSCYSILKRDQDPKNSQDQLCWVVSVPTALAVVGLSTLRSHRRSTYCKVDKTLASWGLQSRERLGVFQAGKGRRVQARSASMFAFLVTWLRRSLRKRP